jgi:hypothetical protein
MGPGTNSPSGQQPSGDRPSAGRRAYPGYARLFSECLFQNVVQYALIDSLGRGYTIQSMHGGASILLGRFRLALCPLSDLGTRGAIAVACRRQPRENPIAEGWQDAGDALSFDDYFVSLRGVA